MCARPDGRRAPRPLGELILIADGFHNVIDGLAAGAALHEQIILTGGFAAGLLPPGLTAALAR